MTFERKKLASKPGKVLAVKIRNRSEKEKIKPEREPKPKKSLHEQMTINGYTATILGLGVAIGGFFGAWGNHLVTQTDEKLLEDIKYYKEQRNIAINQVDSLKNDNEMLLSERESLQEQLTAQQKDNKTLNESLNKVNEELKQYMEIESTNTNSTSGNLSKIRMEEKEIQLNESMSFFDGKIYVGATYIGLYSTSIQIGADGYKSEEHVSANVGSQINYESNSKYQIRINKIESNMNKIVVQVTEF